MIKTLAAVAVLAAGFIGGVLVGGSAGSTCLDRAVEVNGEMAQALDISSSMVLEVTGAVTLALDDKFDETARVLNGQQGPAATLEELADSISQKHESLRLCKVLE